MLSNLLLGLHLSEPLTQAPPPRLFHQLTLRVLIFQLIPAVSGSRQLLLRRRAVQLRPSELWVCPTTSIKDAR